MHVARRLTLTTVLSTLALGSLSACSSPVPDPDPVAQSVAQALETFDFSSVPLKNADPATVSEDLATAFDSMKDLKHRTTVDSVERPEDEDEDSPTATATFTTVWDVDDTKTDWEYSTSAQLAYDQEAEAWQVDYDQEELTGLEPGHHVALRTKASERGQIRSTDKQALVKDRPVVHLGLDKTRLEDGEAGGAAKKLAKLADVDVSDYVARVKAAGDQAFVEAITLRDNSKREVTDAQVEAIPGGRAITGSEPLALTRTFARPILGTVGQATAEIIKESEGKTKAGDVVGLSGLQAQYDDRLSGTAGLTIASYDPSGQQVEELFERDPKNGKDLTVTLDSAQQKLAEKLLKQVDPTSALVAIRPSDGSVLAAASGPAEQGMNTAMLGKYAPGSTFKVVTALAMLRDGKTPSSKVKCPKTTTIKGKEFKNFDAYPAGKLGTIPLSEAIAQSCNTVFINGAAGLKAKDLTTAGASLGLNPSPSTGVSSFLGSIPDDSTGTTLAANGIGQGVVETSPLGMATVAASVAAGQTVSPHLVESPSPDAAKDPAKKLESKEADELQKMMAGTVTHGTLVGLQKVPGPKVYGKSGTAEYDADENAHAWVIAVQGDLAVAAFVSEGIGGAQTAGPLVADFLTGVQKSGGGN
ncbi:penicillin-binding transpeptidase domain-containing protein [Arthrobacter sp. AOP36-A1-22]|uniref:penicillin-binding transpeptidase domain-containing protein n=1 Tax=unclassified Arthrobacter TaxID=235627 RepID=UPI00264C1765|nr:penicillin-binding protein [Micrococcaceae bacterium]MDN5822758.1 penicillin-binding protein [Micrococcaceae bacterium]MDN5885966.1 penicillin-binding protein [Micrococcaceae bacterium]MDN5904687.1 penicillin-binding protein [Micrococcaceae bacterium]